ncbi:MAG: transaldolase family protein [Candidatus Liptonbacteria bacterium]|nr:transaldolase family protein [Candidatus Liptonbacteria bacterium]
MRPNNLKTKIFLDSGDPEETKAIIGLLGFLDGQTTNPTLIAKNPEAQERLARGEKFTQSEIMAFYRSVVGKISELIPKGSVSIETYADFSTTADTMFAEGKEMFFWVPNAHIKYPTIKAGLEAAERSIKANMRVNMTLCFSQEQAAAVYSATRGAVKGQVFVSPFVGRLDDIGENGMDLIKNIMTMHGGGDGHVEVLSASVRNMDHFLYSIKLGCDIITAPFKILKEWGEKGMPVPDENYMYNAGILAPIPYRQLDLKKGWQGFSIEHKLTTQGIERFAKDWNGLIVDKV